MPMTPIERAARHMRVEALGGHVLQVPSFDEVMAAVVERERRCRVRLLQHAPEAIRWWVGALQAAQDWLDAQPLNPERVGFHRVTGAIGIPKSTCCMIDSFGGFVVVRRLWGTSNYVHCYERDHASIYMPTRIEDHMRRAMTQADM